MGRVVPSQVAIFIDQTIPAARKQDMDQGAKFGVSFSQNGTALAGLIALLDELPPELLVVEEELYASFVAARAALRHLLQDGRSDDPNIRRQTLDVTPGFPPLNPVTVVLRVMRQCPDELPSPLTASLQFLASDYELRYGLRLDINSVNQALANGEWKAATVLAGSVIEALLLWALKQRTSEIDGSSAGAKLLKQAQQRDKTLSTVSASLDYGELANYLEIAREIGDVLEDDTVRQAQLARNFRNLIHPGRAQRLGQKCDRGTALAAVGALEHVVRDLTP